MSAKVVCSGLFSFWVLKCFFGPWNKKIFFLALGIKKFFFDPWNQKKTLGIF
jgi:hypothetical protein